MATQNNTALQIASLEVLMQLRTDCSQVSTAMAPLGYPEIFLAFFCFVFLRRLATDHGPLWNWPVVGMLPGLLVRVPGIHGKFVNILRQSGYSFIFKGPWFAKMDMLCTCDPANVHYIMSRNYENYPKGPEFLKFFDFLGDGIFNSDAEQWRKQRRAAQELINHRRFYRFLVGVSRETVERGLVPVLEHASKHGLIVDLQDLFQRFTFDATCKLVTGYDPGSLSVEFPENPFAKAIDEAERAVFLRHVLPGSWWKLQRWVGFGAEKKLSEACETIDRTIAGYISMKRDELRRGIRLEEEEGIDLLTSYINGDFQTAYAEKEECDNIISEKFLRDTIVNFMLAGRDTTSSALSWFFSLVSSNPSVETRIREELKTVVPAEEAGKCHLFDFNKLSKLPYLHGALCESLRLYPPVPFEHKAPLQPDVLPSGHRVHPDMKILFPLYAMGRMASIWGDDCLEFKPDRWISERGETKHEPSYKFLAFNAGPRACLGKEVAFTQMKAVAAAIILNYNVQVVEGHPIAPCLSIILHMKHGLMVKVSKIRA